MSALNFIRPSILRRFIEQTESSAGLGRSTGDAWHQFLVGQTGIDGGLEDLERLWLRTEGATGGTLMDLWASFLAAKGFTTGSLEDRMKAFFTSPGTAVTYAYLQENGSSRFLIEDGSGVLLLN